MEPNFLTLLLVVLMYQHLCFTETITAKIERTKYEHNTTIQDRFTKTQNFTTKTQITPTPLKPFVTEIVRSPETKNTTPEPKILIKDSPERNDVHSAQHINLTAISQTDDIRYERRERARSGELGSLTSNHTSDSSSSSKPSTHGQTGENDATAALESDELRPPPQSAPVTNDDLYGLLVALGYRVQNFTDGGRPVVLRGDIAYHPHQFAADLPLPASELPPVSARNNMHSNRLWIDSAGRQRVPYYYDVNTRADQAVFEAAVATWAQSTCIKFERQQPGRCDENRGAGAVCVGDFGSCWSFIGNYYIWNRSSQKMSVKPQGCEMMAAAHEFGHALGLDHQQARPDRDEYLWVNYNNIEMGSVRVGKGNSVKDSWSPAAKCARGQTIEVPIPYDYMSIMQYGASDFAGKDGRIVYATRDAHHQYMTDYHRAAGLTQTHYDKLVVNTAYRCTALWRRNCAMYGREPPRCLNGGFAGQRCRCLCPDGYSGAACQTRSGPLYPLQDRARTMLDITEPGSYSLANRGMHLENHGYAVEEFLQYQFVTVAINSGHELAVVRVRLHQPFDAVAASMAPGYRQGSLIGDIGNADCLLTGYFYWGDWGANKIRTECVSSLLTNEPPRRHPWLRSRDRQLEMVAISKLGSYYNGNARLTKAALEMTLTVTFEPGGKVLRTFETAADDPGDLEWPPLAEKGAAGGLVVGVGVAVAVVLLLLLILLFVAWKLGKLPLGKKRTSGAQEEE